MSLTYDSPSFLSKEQSLQQSLHSLRLNTNLYPNTINNDPSSLNHKTVSQFSNQSKRDLLSKISIQELACHHHDHQVETFTNEDLQSIQNLFTTADSHLKSALRSTRTTYIFISRLFEAEDYRVKSLFRACSEFNKQETDNSSVLRLRELFNNQTMVYYRSTSSFKNISVTLKNLHDSASKTRKEVKRSFQKELEKLLSIENTSRSLTKKLENVEAKFISISPKATLVSEGINSLRNNRSSSGSINTVKTAKSRASLFFPSKRVSPIKEFDDLKSKLSTLSLKHSEHMKKEYLKKESFLEDQFPALIKIMENLAQELSFISLRELYTAIDSISQTCCSLLEFCAIGIELGPCVARIIHVIEQLGGLTTFTLYATPDVDDSLPSSTSFDKFSCGKIDVSILSNLSQLLKRSLSDFFPKDIFSNVFIGKVYPVIHFSLKSEKSPEKIETNSMQFLKSTIGEFSKNHYALVSTLFLHLHRLSVNAMTNGTNSQDIATIFYPILTDYNTESHDMPDSDKIIYVIKFLIDEAEKIFCNSHFK